MYGTYRGRVALLHAVLRERAETPARRRSWLWKAGLALVAAATSCCQAAEDDAPELFSAVSLAAGF